MNARQGETHRSVHRGEVSSRSCNNLPPLTLLASSDWDFIKSPAHANVPAKWNEKGLGPVTKEWAEENSGARHDRPTGSLKNHATISFLFKSNREAFLRRDRCVCGTRAMENCCYCCCCA